eukprot:SAG31_NODE_309_length_17949_cov_11.083361_6_plen_117_part_00
MGGGGGKAIAERGANSGGCINTPGTVPRPTFRLVRASSGSLLMGGSLVMLGASPAAGIPCRAGWLVDLIIKNNISEAGSETKFRSGRRLLRGRRSHRSGYPARIQDSSPDFSGCSR